MPSDTLQTALVSAAAALIGGIAAGYLIGRSTERRVHDLEDLAQLTGDDSGLTAADSEMSSTASSPPDSPIQAKKRTNAIVASVASGTPPRPPRKGSVEAVGRTANAGVVVHIDQARRKVSMDQRAGPIIVGVAGGSGSGKTSIANLIAARLRDTHVVSISSDNYYIPLEKGAKAEEHNWDHPTSIEFSLLATHLAALKRGETVQVPTYDFSAHNRTAETITICGRTCDVVIVDGIFVLWSEEVRAMCDVTLFTSEDSDVCLARRLRRDIVERGRTVESVLAQYLKFVKPGYERFVAPSMSAADFVIPRAKENTVAISMLAHDVSRRVADRRRGGV